jgi:hypothetical protein
MFNFDPVTFIRFTFLARIDVLIAVSGFDLLHLFLDGARL